MFSPGDDQDDNLFDQLRSIRPFTVDQLYLIHPDVGCPPKAAISSEVTNADGDDKFTIPPAHKELHRHLVEFEQLRNQLVKLKHDIKKLYKRTHEHIDQVWLLKEEVIKKVAMCQQGRVAEATFKFNKAYIDKKQLTMFSQEFTELTDLITKDYIYYSFESQVKRNKILTHLSIAYQLPDLEARKTELKSSIVTLFEFLRFTSDSKPDFVILCRKWLRALCKRYLDGGTTQDYRFIVSQLARSSVGTADWSADLVECRPFEQISGFDSAPQYITHCSTILSELFYNLQLRIKQLTITTAATTGDNNEQQTIEPSDNTIRKPSHADQNWSLVDPRFNCAEELDLTLSNYNLLSESDVIKFCLRIPIAQIFRAYVKKCLEVTAESHMETEKNYEFVMLKLLTIGTVIIKTYQIGLETFNSIQYGSLIEYLSSQIRRTVVILSDQWSEFKRRLRGVDDALLMRLQVEYDNFMLRSILIILELRQSGIWRHLSRVERDVEMPSYDNPLSWSTDSLRPAFAKLLQVTGISGQQQQHQQQQQLDSETGNENLKVAGERSVVKPKGKRKQSSSLTYEFSTEWFKDVSEPMLWHILWQFYHNAFVSSCDYHSDYYWLKKFQEKSVIFLFINKVKDSPPGECSYLINSITSMLLSRSKPESKLVNFIATEIFNLTFKNKPLKEKVARKGVSSLIRCAEKFPNLISLYLASMDDDIDENATELIKSCSLSGWICDEKEFALLEGWLIENPLDAPKNKIARLIICKILRNSSDNLTQGTIPESGKLESSITNTVTPRVTRRESRRTIYRFNDCIVNLKMRRKLALVLYHASTVHLPENNQFGPQSLGASVEVAFGSPSLFGSNNETGQDNLLELAIDSSYQQFYIWTWRILFALRLHILHQAETDWNDVQVRSGTSRSIRNTVLVNDPFYPVPLIVDSECSLLTEGVKSQNPVASFIYLLLTDVTWHSDTVDACLTSLNALADSGHITPSLMAMKFFTICHLNDLTEDLLDDKRCIDYFRKVIVSNFDATCLASLIMTQLDHLKQFRQLQLSHFYIKVLLDVGTAIARQMSSSWFSSNEISLEKVACVLDFIVRFNFTHQRVELIRKFYDCAYVIQDQQVQANGWLSSFLTSNSPQRDFLTNLHVLARKFKKYAWLQWITSECDALRLEKVWEDIVAYLSTNDEANLDSALKKVCPNLNFTSIRSTLPIYSWIGQIFDLMETDLNHPLCPLIWYNFFLNYFANSLNSVSVGVKLVSQETLSRLMTRLDSLYNYHLYKQRNWSTSSAMQQSTLTQLYRAYKLWLQDPSLRDAYVDIDRLKDDYLVPLLKAVMESSNAGACLQYVDLDSIETQNRNLIQVWTSSTRSSLDDEKHLVDDPIIYLDNNELDEATPPGDRSIGDDELADDAVSLIAARSNTGAMSDVKTNRSLDDSQEELSKPLDSDYFGEPKYRPVDELIDAVKRQFGAVFEESNVFQLNISELNKIKTEIIDLVSRLYANKRRTFIRVAPCIEGNECAGPARIKLEADEALIDERKSQCIQDRRRQCQELVGELLLMPKNISVRATMTIEDYIKRMIDDPIHSKMVIETLLAWLSETDNYEQLNGSFYTANHLLKTVLEILSTTDQTDAYNYSLIKVCLEHPESVQILSPHLSPSSCSTQCFLENYRIICSKQTTLSPMATFVLLSKFDLRSWLATTSRESKQSYHELIITTCSAFGDLGKNPDRSYDLTMDLFKRHLQIELAPSIRQKPDELFLVLDQLSKLMDQQTLAPNLWLDFLAIIGLDVHQNNAKQGDRQHQQQQQHGQHPQVENITENVARLAECQTVFDHQSLCIMVQSISKYLRHRHELNEKTLLEFYQDYVDQYGLVILSVTFMWIKSTSEASLEDSYESLWEQFMGIWVGWVLPTKACQAKSGYNLMVDFYVTSLHYMMHKIPECIQSVLRFLLADLASYVEKLGENLNLELNILQRCLKNLPWSNLMITTSEVDHLAALSESTRHNMSELVSHVMAQLDLRKFLAHLEQEDGDSTMSRTVEQLCWIIISQSHHLKGFRLPDKYLSNVPTASIGRLASAILARADYVNLESSHTNRLLFRLLNEVVSLSSNHSAASERDHTNNQDTSLHQADAKQAATNLDQYERAVIYARFVSDYLTNLVKRNPAIVQTVNAKPLIWIIDDTLKRLVRLDGLCSSDRKRLLYASAMDVCNCETLDIELRLQMARLFVDSASIRNEPDTIVEMVQTAGQSLRDPKILVNTIETLVDSYYTKTGHYETISECLHVSALELEVYLNFCIRERTSLALMIYFESQHSRFLRQKTIATSSPASAKSTSTQHASQCSAPSYKSLFWSSYLHWLAQFVRSMGERSAVASLTPDNALKLTTLMVRLLILLETDLEQFVLLDHLCDYANESITCPSLPFASHDKPRVVAVDENPSRSGQSDANDSTISTATSPSKQSAKLSTTSVSTNIHSFGHKSYLAFLNGLVSFYDSINAGGLWSYLVSSAKSEHSVKISVTSLAIACFLADRTLLHMNSLTSSMSSASSSAPEVVQTQLKFISDELVKLRRNCLTRLRAVRKTKSASDCAQFVDSFIESVQQNSKVQYGEVVQLIGTYVLGQ